MTFQRSPFSGGGRPCIFPSCLAFAALGVFALPLTISLLLVFLSLLAASVAPSELGLGHCPGAGRPCCLQPSRASVLPWQALWQAPNLVLTIGIYMTSKTGTSAPSPPRRPLQAPSLKS